MILEHRTLLVLTVTDTRTAEKYLAWNFFLHETTRTRARTAKNNHHVIFSPNSYWLQRLKNYLKICRLRNFV